MKDFVIMDDYVNDLICSINFAYNNNDSELYFSCVQDLEYYVSKDMFKLLCENGYIPGQVKF